MCRARTNGEFAISKGEGDYVLPLVDWQPSEAIRREINLNHIRAICIGDTLPMMVHDQLIAEITATTYTNRFAGLSVAAVENSDVPTT